MNRFDDVKVGDMVMVCHRAIGLRSFSGTRYSLEVWESETVTKVTKTQFSTGEHRYQKSGRGVGGDSHAYHPGEKRSSYQSDVPLAPTPDTVIKEHERKISSIYKAGLLVDRSFQFGKLTSVDDAVAVADLILQAHSLYTERGAACQ